MKRARLAQPLTALGPAFLALAVAASCGGGGSATPQPFVDAGGDAYRKLGNNDGGHTTKLGSDAAMDTYAPDSCAATTKMATPPAPLEMVLLMDRSGSMAYNNSWNYEVQALTQFFEDSNSAGIGVGLLYMPIVSDLCNPAAYAVPAVPVSLLPGAQGDLITSLGSTLPFGGSPITIGFEGAVAYAKQRQMAEPTHDVVILYATDAVGINSCAVVPDGGLPNTLANATQVLTEAAASTPPIKTFVIGVAPEVGHPTGATGMALHNAANTFAAAGGTGQAFLVGATAGDGGPPTDFEGRFISALEAIRDQVHIPCKYGIPPSSGGAINFADVNVTFTPSATAPVQTFYGVASASACQAKTNDWYYDDPSDPQNIVFCPTACQAVTASTMGTVNIDFGCTPTIPAPPILK